MEYPERKKFISYNNWCTISSVNTENDTKNWMVSRIITGFQNLTQQKNLLSGGVTIYPTNGIMNQVSSVNQISDAANINIKKFRKSLLWSLMIA